MGTKNRYESPQKKKNVENTKEEKTEKKHYIKIENEIKRRLCFVYVFQCEMNGWYCGYVMPTTVNSKKWRHYRSY